ncbi:hypothetical protein INS49_014445 [Diaporthe citri]|uniref:uncharacterized protein n=1 Tax=Diaporthe citri TaxID=83186 RepID=UPI001C804465|nr:uncharacterized protein INS49_014445 [Diaporthe citri]KAG6356572.1 hypothetical protein INS49_014445 [Diaporthe citri]
MNRKNADSSASDVSASGHSDSSNKSKAIATGAAKVFNKIILNLRYVGPTLGDPKSEPLNFKDKSQTLRMNTGVADAEDNSAVPGKAVISPGSTTLFLGPSGNGPLDKLRKGLDAPEPTPSALAPGKTRPTRPRRPPSADSTVASSVEDTDSDDKTLSHRVPSARDARNPQRKTQDPLTMAPDAARMPKKSTCYFCQEDCEPGDNLCSKCQTRFQPQEEVFEYSESEYEDDIELEDATHSSLETEKPPATSRRSLKRRTTGYPKPREKSRGWSEFSSVSQLQQLASRSASTSPTSHVALELKVVPPQDIKIRTVSSPTRTNAGDGGSALHHIQQAMKPRGSVSPCSQDRDAIRLGKVRSGEIRRVDIPDIIKAKPPTPKENSFQRNSEEHQHQSSGSLANWLKYYEEDDKNSERHSGSSQSNCAYLPNNSENSAVPATPGTYDCVTSIYDLYASFEDT